MPLPQYPFFNGKIIPYSEAKVGVLTHGLNYGTGAFGGVRGYWNEEEKQLFIFRPFDHFKRFLESGKILRMTFPYSVEDLVKTTQELIKKEGHKCDCYVRPLAFYSDEMIGVRLHDLKPALSICALPFGRYVDKEEGAHVTISSWKRIDDNIGAVVGAGEPLNTEQEHKQRFRVVIVGVLGVQVRVFGQDQLGCPPARRLRAANS